MSLLLLADMVVMAAPVVMVAVVVVLAGQLAVSSTAESCAFLQSLNLERQEVLRPCTRSISSLAEQELRSDLGVLCVIIGSIFQEGSYFMANASVQQVQSSLVLQPSTLV